MTGIFCPQHPGIGEKRSPYPPPIRKKNRDSVLWTQPGNSALFDGSVMYMTVVKREAFATDSEEAVVTMASALFKSVRHKSMPQA